jgi:hypothetical protein
MQKISSYLLKNRIQLVADLAAFPTEWTIVYQRQVKIYKGIDNTLEFDIKNADQKRLDLLGTISPAVAPEITDIQVNIMDHNGYAITDMPYTATPTAVKGIAAITIPAADIENLEDQFLTFSVTATKDSADVLLYADTRFSGSGTIQLLSNAMPKTRAIQTYDDFYGLGDYDNKHITYSSSSIFLKFRDAVPPNHLHITVEADDFVGRLWVEGTKDTVVGNESFTYKGTTLYSVEYTTSQTGSIVIPLIEIADYTFLRVNWTKNKYRTPGVLDNGKVTSFTTEFHSHPPEQPC